MSIGIGYDSHRFAKGRRLILGGVEIPHDMGLDGHSDADVLTHAVIDAILGAGGQGDIGTLFPDSEDQWEGADSLDLLRTAVGVVAGRIINIDATVVCEAPKIGPYRSEIELRLGEITSARVNVKGTTNESMGWIGRGEGIGCMAVAQIADE